MASRRSPPDVGRSRQNETDEFAAWLVSTAGAQLPRHADALLSEVARPLSSDELRQALAGSAGVLTYDEAFPDSPEARGWDLRAELARWPARALVFLYRQTPTFGHWIAIFDRGDDLYVFDPYGQTPPDAWGAGRPAQDLESLGQDRPRLLGAMLRANYRAIEWNDIPLQYPDQSVQTCGRWAVTRIAGRSLGVDEFAAAILSAARALGVSTDALVCGIVPARG